MFDIQYHAGQDWNYEDYDGGEGSLGTVLQLKDDDKVVVSVFF